MALSLARTGRRLWAFGQGPGRETGFFQLIQPARRRRACSSRPGGCSLAQQHRKAPFAGAGPAAAKRIPRPGRRCRKNGGSARQRQPSTSAQQSRFHPPAGCGRKCRLTGQESCCASAARIHAGCPYGRASSSKLTHSTIGSGQLGGFAAPDSGCGQEFGSIRPTTTVTCARRREYNSSCQLLSPASPPKAT